MKDTRKNLLFILILGLILRLGLLAFFWSQPLTIVDEQHYHQIAENIYRNGEFARIKDNPTSMRPPLYPSFLAGIYFITGGIHFNAVRIVQIFLNLGIVCMVYVLGKKIFDEKIGLLAALIFAIYPSFLFFTNFLLTEVLFTLLFTIFIYFFLQFVDCCRFLNNQYSQPAAENLRSSIHNPMPDAPDKEGSTPRAPSQHPTFSPSVLSPSHPHTFSSSVAKKRYALCLTSLRNLKLFIKLLCSSPYALCALSGLFLGLSALTRSILYPFVAPAVGFLLLFGQGKLKKRLAISLVFVIGYAIVIAPWAIRNMKLFNQFVAVGTMGGLNLYMGNYEHTPLNRAWAAVDLPYEKAWYRGYEDELAVMNEAQKQKWAAAKAKDFMLQHKMLTTKRSLVKAANLWGLERSVLGGIVHNHWPELKSTPLVVAIGMAIFGVYCAVLLTAIYGFFFNIAVNPVRTSFILLLLAFFTGMHAIVFGHSRYHLPLVPLLSIYCAWSIIHFRSIFKKAKSWCFLLASVFASMTVIIWVREIFFIEADRFFK